MEERLNPDDKTPFALLFGTCDTKLSELLFVHSHILNQNVNVRLLDIGRTSVSHDAIFYKQSDLWHSSSKPDLALMDRGSMTKVIIEAAASFVKQLRRSLLSFSGAICIGGSGGTSIGASVMRTALPIGFPKIIVSTVASGNISNFVGGTDITMMNSVVDIAGQNSILNPVLENAAGMIAGAVKVYSRRPIRENSDARQRSKGRVAITMFGVTTPVVDTARADLELHGFEVIVFHATGSGGNIMEDLISRGKFDGVLDLTTTELADELVGGIMKSGPDRLTAAAKAGIPQVVSLGAMDMVNFGPRETVPSKFSDRRIYEHNPDITIIRTTPKECRILGKQVAEKLKGNSKRPEMVKVFIPCGGISMLAVEGAPFHDEEADTALFDAVTEGLKGSGIEIISDHKDINDGDFAAKMAKTLIELMD